MVRNLASEYGVDKKYRTFSAWSQVVSLLYTQLTHSIGLNDVCDALCHHSSKVFAIRGATPPSRNGFSHANKTRDADMMEALF
jgi:hypothetical protein